VFIRAGMEAQMMAIPWSQVKGLIAAVFNKGNAWNGLALIVGRH